MMGDYVVVATKIPRRLKELADELGIKPSHVMRKALEDEVRRRLLENLEKRAIELKKRLPEIPDEEIAELIREDRER
jgi:predicted transcriptional regulator